MRLPRRSHGLVAFHVLGILASITLLLITASSGDWSPTSLVVALFALAVLVAVSSPRQQELPIQMAPTEVVVAPAMVLLGPVPAAVVSLLTTVRDDVTHRPDYPRALFLAEQWTAVAWPIAGWFAFSALAPPTVDAASASFLLATAAGLFVGMAVNAALVLFSIWLFSRHYGGKSPDLSYFATTVRGVTALLYVLSIAIVAIYGTAGTYALFLVVLAIVIFRLLVDQLLLLRVRERELTERNEQLTVFHIGVLGLLTDTLAQRDLLTARHSAAVARWARDLTQASGAGAHAQWTVHTAALLHDIGKFVVPDSILHHEGQLTDVKKQLMKAHAEDGARLVARVAGLEAVGELIRHHHERFDGSGYPDGLAGTKIPIGARILAVCEAYDAMTARDSYLLPVPPAQAVERLKADAGTAFDPVVVKRFVELLESRDAAYGHGDDARFQQELDRAVAAAEAGLASASLLSGDGARSAPRPVPAARASA